jgi:hypothetical protein
MGGSRPAFRKQDLDRDMHVCQVMTTNPSTGEGIEVSQGQGWIRMAGRSRCAGTETASAGLV